MNYGFLSQHFDGVAAKRLSVVEANPTKSNQHEFNGVEALKRLLGTEEFSQRPAVFMWIGGENEGVTEEAWVSWYNSRKGKPRAAEWRLYFAKNAVMELARPDDLLLVATRSDGGLLLIVLPSGSTVENQLAWLFGLDGELGAQFRFEDIGVDTDRELDFAARYILEEIGVEFEEPEADRLDALLERFGTRFPTTREFSLFAQQTLPDVEPRDDPDGALLAWLTHEEALFRRLERHVISARLTTGFVADGSTDVDAFLKFSLSVQNRRKSRMGFALENHLETVFAAHGLRYERGARTEEKSKPDFLFPGAAEYLDPAFPEDRLTMLGAKSTCKDRWRQVLSEAARIEQKHLLTLEPGISENQTAEMQRRNLQLVVPAGVHKTYTAAQASWLMTPADFIRQVRDQQGV